MNKVTKIILKDVWKLIKYLSTWLLVLSVISIVFWVIVFIFFQFREGIIMEVLAGVLGIIVLLALVIGIPIASYTSIRNYLRKAKIRARGC